jgi:prolyl oligopeptidase
VFLPQEHRNLIGLSGSKDFLFAIHSNGVTVQVRQYNVRTGQWSETPKSMTGTAWVWPIDRNSNECLLAVSSWNKPETMYDYRPVTRQAVVSPFHVSVTYPGIDDVVVEEVEVPSHDGIMVPLSLIYRKGIPRDGSARCIMEGYGAVNLSLTPYFDYMNHVLVLKNVVHAIAHVRGGGEKGQDWHKGGYKTTKPNTWKDFIACAEWLVSNKYTSPQYLVGMGTSAGGIAVGRAITDRPDLFAAAINNVGVTNMLRVETTANEPVNTPEFGTVKDSVECMALMEMDAMHHVKEGVKYPAVINVGGWNDSRVTVWQPGKFAAALQNASTSGKPVLMQVNYDNGHYTEDKQVTFRNFANMFAFALWQAGHPEFQPAKVGLKR